MWPFYRVRRFAFLSIAVVSLLVLAGIPLLGWTIHNSTDPAQNAMVLATALQVTATLSGLSIALVFVSAQLSSSAGRHLVLRELYRGWEVYVLLGYSIATILTGYVALASAGNFHSAGLMDATVVLAITSVLLIVPTLAQQIENLDPLNLAAKLVDRIGAKGMREYGLTEVFPASDASRLKSRLIMAGLRPADVDPLRPMHEVLMEAVNARDRVLFGKLFRHLLRPIAECYGTRWDVTATHLPMRPARRCVPRFRSLVNNDADRLHLTLGILHYSVKRARNLRGEWDGRDIGRHGILTAIADLIVSLTERRETESALQLCIFAALHISAEYAEVQPYGRIEPLNAYFEAAQRLDRTGRAAESTLCLEVLAWITAHGSQLTDERSRMAFEKLDESLQQIYRAAKKQAISNPSWVPGLAIDDPWREIPWAKDALVRCLVRQNLRPQSRPL